MGKSIPNKTINQIESLRQKGHSISEISHNLKVAKSTVSRYASKIAISPEYIQRLVEKRKSSKKRRDIKQRKAYEEARVLIPNLSQKEKILFLSALYWAEGSKKDFGLSNTDPNLIKVFVNSLRELFCIENSRFRVSIRIYEDLNKKECLQFWSKVVNIPEKEFVSVNILPGKNKGKLQYGMCRVRISKGEELLKKIQAIYTLVSQIEVPIA